MKFKDGLEAHGTPLEIKAFYVGFLKNTPKRFQVKGKTIDFM